LRGGAAEAVMRNRAIETFVVVGILFMSGVAATAYIAFGAMMR
jgi:hypothetical protein